MNNPAIRKLLFGSSLAILGAVTPAYAQDADVGDIVVTARRVEERLQDVPISITVLNQNELSNANVVNAADLATLTPSLSANSNFGSENSSFAIRGFVQDIGTQPSVGVYFNDVVAPRGFSNGLVAGDGAGPGSFFDLQNVQVLKGPQGTLFGRNTTGGAILLVPHRPTDDFEGYVQGGVGNYDMRRAQGVVNIPLGDQAALRLGVDHQEREGYLHNTSGIGPEDFNDVNYTAYRAGFRVNLTPNLESYTLATYTDSNTNGSSQKLVVTDPTSGQFPRFNALGELAEVQLANQGSDFYDFQQDIPNPESVLRTWQLINTTTWDLSDNLTFKNIVSYGELVQDLTNPIFGTNLETAAGDPISFSITSPVNHTAAEGTFTEEARFEGTSFNSRLTWQGGVYFERSDPLGAVGSFSPVLAHCGDLGHLSSNDVLSGSGRFDAALDACSAPLGNNQGVVNVTIGETRSQTTGVYVQGTYDITDQLDVTLGYRYTWDRIKDTANQYTYSLASTAAGGGSTGFTCSNYLASAPDCASTYSVQTEAPTWLIGLDYTPMEDWLLYAKYARGYRSGTISPNVVDPLVDTNNDNVPDTPLTGALTTADAEHVDAYEIGSKWTFSLNGMRGIFNASAFYNDFQNQQLQIGFVRFDVPAAPTAAPLNVGSSEIYGAELQASIQPIEGLTLAADYTYLHTEVIESPATIDADGDGNSDLFVGPYLVIGSVVAGDPLVLSPQNKYTLTAQYELPLDQSIGSITLGAQLQHSDEQLVAGGNAHSGTIFEDYAYLPSLDLVNVNISWESVMGSQVDLNVFGTNVTDEEYYTYFPGIGQVTEFETGVVGQPRMYGITATYHFN